MLQPQHMLRAHVALNTCTCCVQQRTYRERAALKKSSNPVLLAAAFSLQVLLVRALHVGCYPRQNSPDTGGSEFGGAYLPAVLERLM